MTPTAPQTPGPAVVRGRELRIGSLRVSPPLLMAPMAGLTHIAFRRLLAEMGGVGLFYSEMLSARALPHERPGGSRHLAGDGESRPLCIQIFASDAGQVGPAVEGGSRWHPEAWDLNLGCPAPEIVRQGAGSALAEDLPRTRRLAAAMRRHVSGPLLFKLRGGRDGSSMALADLLAGEGADALVIHGRSPGEKLGRPARWDSIAEAASRLPIPVIGNGDVAHRLDAVRMMETTGCAGVMIGRAGVERPWLFRSAAASFGCSLAPPPYRRKSEVFLRLAHLLAETLGHPRDLYRLKAFTVYFARNFKFGHQLWKDVHNARALDEAVDRAAGFFGRQGDEDAIRE